jgi:hypothetical protein
MNVRLFTTKSKLISLITPALKGVKKINLLPPTGGWGEQIDFQPLSTMYW